MKTVESRGVLESFGFISEGKGLFKEVSEFDLLEVGGACGGGWNCDSFCPLSSCDASYTFCAPVSGGGSLGW